MNETTTTRSLEEISTIINEKETEASDLFKNFDKRKINNFKQLLSLFNARYGREHNNTNSESNKAMELELENKVQQLITVLNNPIVEPYLCLKKEVIELKKEYREKSEIELEHKKKEFTENVYTPLLAKVEDKWGKLYNQLEYALEGAKKEADSYGMTLKASKDLLPTQEQYAIGKLEDHMRALENMEKVIKANYPLVISANNHRGYERGVGRFNFCIEKEEEKFTRNNYNGETIY